MLRYLSKSLVFYFHLMLQSFNFNEDLSTVPWGKDEWRRLLPFAVSSSSVIIMNQSELNSSQKRLPSETCSRLGTTRRLTMPRNP